MAAPYRPAKSVRGRWGDAESAVLIAAWAPIYKRLRDGEGDSSRGLVAADWRVVAAAVNAHRDGDAALQGSHRTWQQCQGRVKTLVSNCWKMRSYSRAAATPESRRIFAVLRGVLSPTGTGQEATSEPSPVHLHHQTMETDEAEAARPEDGNVEVVPPALQQQEDDIVGTGDDNTEVGTRGAVAEDDNTGYAGVRRSATMAALLWGGASRLPTPKRRRSFASTSGAANLGGGASADGFNPDSVVHLLGSESAKEGSASLFATVGKMWNNAMAVMMKSLEAGTKDAAARGSKEP